MSAIPPPRHHLYGINLPARIIISEVKAKQSSFAHDTSATLAIGTESPRSLYLSIVGLIVSIFTYSLQIGHLIGVPIRVWKLCLHVGFEHWQSNQFLPIESLRIPYDLIYKI